MKILVVEDELELLLEIKEFMSQEDFLCETASSFDEADIKLSLYEYDVAVIDITLPGGSGLQLIKNLKEQKSNTGIMIISAKNSLDDRLYGLVIGADDYLTKPFHMAELNSRINAILRRRKFDGQNEIEFNEIVIRPETGVVCISGKQIFLTKKEYELLLFFIGNRNRLLTRESIAEHLWGEHINLADNYDFVYVHINNLRRKIMKAAGRDYLKTIYGMGYKLTDS